MLSAESIAKYFGALSSPSELPKIPNLKRNVPSGACFFILLLSLSTTQIFPDESIAIPSGLSNLESSEPLVVPNESTK